MARVRTTTCNGQGAEKKCGSCGHVIAKGEKYLHAKPGFRTRRPLIRCLKHPFRESDLITGNRQEIVRAKEDALDAIDGADTFEDLASAMSEFESAADDYLSMREEALDQWPNGNSQLEEYRDQAQAIVDEVSGWSSDYSDTYEPDDDDLDRLHEEAGDEPHSRDDLVELWLQEKLDEAKDEARDTLEGLDA